MLSAGKNDDEWREILIYDEFGGCCGRDSTYDRIPPMSRSRVVSIVGEIKRSIKKSNYSLARISVIDAVRPLRDRDGVQRNLRFSVALDCDSSQKLAEGNQQVERTGEVSTQQDRDRAINRSGNCEICGMTFRV